MHMISLPLKGREGVGEPTQFNKVGIVAWTCVWVFVVRWNAFIQEEETFCKEQGSQVQPWQEEVGQQLEEEMG